MTFRFLYMKNKVKREKDANEADYLMNRISTAYNKIA